MKKILITIFLSIKNVAKRFHIFGMKRYNCLKFWLNGVEFGKNLDAYFGIYIRKSKSAKFLIGNNFRLISGGGENPLCRNLRASFLVEDNALLEIQDNVGMSSPSIWVHEKITIGRNVLIGGGTVMIDTDAHNLDWRVRLEKDDIYEVASSPICIENNVFIGAYCIILKGVTIGEGAVIGAGSVVCKDIPPFSIAAGNPCRVIKEGVRT